MVKTAASIVFVVIFAVAAFGQDIRGGEKTIDLDDPNGEHTIREVTNQAKVTISGRIKTLRVTKIVDESIVDAGYLHADQVIVNDIGGHSDLIISARAFSFTRIHDQSVVLFNVAPGAVALGDEITDESRLFWFGGGLDTTGIKRIGGHSKVRPVCFQK